MTLTQSLATLYHRDLTRLISQIAAFPSDDALWHTLPGIINSAGNLALHLEGNLREFIGRQMADLPYIRERDLEFTTRDLTRADLNTRLTALQAAIPAAIEQLSPDRVASPSTRLIDGAPISNADFILHLYGHLNWHLGQIDYLRRILPSKSS